MTWLYSQSTGKLSWDGPVIATCYSGHGEGLNNPEKESVPNVGPVPKGFYEISSPFDTESHGPFVMRLIPKGPTNTFGRSGFMIHGDSIENAGREMASHGCIVAPRSVRDTIAKSEDDQLEVTG